MVTSVGLSSANPTVNYTFWGTFIVKNIVRAFVLVLTLSGSAAYATLTFSHHGQPVGKSDLAVPGCPPDDSNGCGIHNKN